jgi:hypothetical protein
MARGLLKPGVGCCAIQAYVVDDLKTLKELSNWCPKAAWFLDRRGSSVNVLAFETEFIFAAYEHDCICRFASRQ